MKTLLSRTLLAAFVVVLPGLFLARDAWRKPVADPKDAPVAQTGQHENIVTSPTPAAAAGPAAPTSPIQVAAGPAMPPTPSAPVPNRSGAATSSKRAWDERFLSSLSHAVRGDAVTFELAGGEQASGTIKHLEHVRNEVVYVAGELSQPEPGRFFFQRQTQPGVAGSAVGVVELPGSRRAFRIEPTGPGKAPELVEHALAEVVCLRLPRPEHEQDADTASGDAEEIPPLKPGDFPTVPIPAYQKGIIVLESLPGATGVIYLDYQGGYTPTWGGITYERPNVSNSQIREVWLRVAEDYMPFQINVTTDLKVYQNAPENSRQRVVITPTSTAAPGAGGVAYIGSWNWTGDTPCWVFMTSGKACAEAASHEVGHTLGLGHDGADANGNHTEYYGGQGSGTTGWAPIMGVGYDQNVSQWSKGEYANANNDQDDLAVMTSQNSVEFRVDDTGDSLPTSRYLEISPTFTVTGQGVIEQTGDTDAFQFTTTGGFVSLRVEPVGTGPNLALQATLYDEADQLLVSHNPTTVLFASVSTNLPAGTYTLRVTGTGRNNALTSGFSSYASLGYYSISGSAANARVPTRFTLPENVTNGTVVGVIPAQNPAGDPLNFTITAGNTGGTFSIDASGTLTVADSTLLDYEALARPTQFPVQFELFVDITNPEDSQQTELNRRVVVAITNVNEMPSLTGFSATLIEHTRPGTVVGTVDGSDPDFYTLLSLSISDGNTNNLFAIDSQTGVITLKGDLDAATQNLHLLTVTASDQASPTPLIATSLVTITVVPNTTPFQPGSISYAVYTNIAGNLLTSLTSSSRFPNDPALEKQLLLFEGDRDRDDNYGAVIRGFLLPPTTGDYTFWIAADDNAELWMSTTTNPATMTRIASISGDGRWSDPREWTKYTSQRSLPRNLVAGQGYYVEARVKEGSGGDHIAVAWECAGAGLSQEVIPGKYLAPYSLNYIPHPIGFTTSLHRDAIAGARVGTVRVTDVNTNDVSTLTIFSGNTGGLFSLDPVTGDLRVANEEFLLNTGLSKYTLQIRATDNGSPARASTATVTVNLVAPDVIATNSIQQELWRNIGGSTAVSALTSNIRYPRRPDALRPLTGFDSSDDNYADNYGSRIRAVLIPATSGSYNFYIASDDSSQLKFTASTNYAAATTIASVSGATAYRSWTTASSQRSTAISLVAGQRYYLEAIHKEGGGDDHLAVAWTGPGYSTPTVIPSSVLKPLNINHPPTLADRSVTLSITATNGALVTTMAATDSAMDSLAYKIVSGNPQATFAINPDNGQVTVSNRTTFTTYAESVFNLVIMAQDTGYGGVYPLQSTQATLRVQIVDDSPTYTWTGEGSNAQWSTPENWAPGLPPENAKLVFTGTSRSANTNDLLTQVGSVTFNNGGFRIEGNPLVLLGGLSSSGDNTWAIPATLRSSQTIQAASGTLTFAGSLDNGGQLLKVVAQENLHFTGSISGAGGLEKTGPGSLTLATANTFSGVCALVTGRIVLAHPLALGQSSRLELQSGTVLDAGGLPGPLLVPLGQTLAGSGIVTGNVRIEGTLAPGVPPTVMTFNDSPALAGLTLMALEKDGTSSVNSQINAAKGLVYGGSLQVTHEGAALAAGDTFKLFAAGSFAGAFSNILLPPPGEGLGWNTSSLATDGTIRVTSAQLQFKPVAVVDGQLRLQFDSVSGVSYVLEAATRLEPPADWSAATTNAGTGGALTLTLPLDPSKPRVFYRLRAD
jgi:hypothetical protein